MPISANNAMETNVLLSDFSDAAVDAIFRQIGLFGHMIFEVPFNRDEVALIIDRSARLPGNPSRRE
jgi:hypothetical protein